MKTWHWLLIAGLVVLVLLSIPQTRCTLTGGNWANYGGYEGCY